MKPETPSVLLGPPSSAGETPPPSPDTRLARTRGWLLWGFWWLFLGVWTASLLTTTPAELSAEMLPPEPDYLVTNASHVVVYGILAGALAWLPCRRKWVVVVFLSLHAMGTEVAQMWVDRIADLMDVGLNHLGILLGLLFAWWMAWRRKG